MSALDRPRQIPQNAGISRRQVMQYAAVLGISGAISTHLDESAWAAEPNRGGRFRLGTLGGSAGDTLDPAQIPDFYMINLSYGQLRNCLTEIASDGSLVGELAESWDASADAATWTFKIRRNVEFHNGRTLEADDVVASMNHHRGAESTSAAKGILASVDSVDADDKHTVTFRLSGGSGDFPYLVSDFHLSICPADGAGGIDWRSGVGTGGYSLVSLDPGVRALTKRNPNYWKAGHANFDEVETLNISDVSARTNALRTGQIDAMTKVDFTTLEMLKKTSGIAIFATTGNQHVTLPMLTDVAPYDNNHLRLALKHAIDREQWLQTLVKGYGKLANDHPIGPANQYQATSEEIPQRSYDPDKARFHLKKAGYDKIDLQLHVAETGFAGSIDAAQLYRESAKESGLNIQVVRESNDGYWSDVWLKKPWCASRWSGRPTEDWILTQIYSADAEWNETNWTHERFNKLLVEARAMLDGPKRREIYVEMQRLISEEGGVVIPYFVSNVHGISDKIGLPKQIAENLPLDGEKCAERWWFN